MILQEWDKDEGYTGDQVKMEVSYIFYGGEYGLDENYCIMGFNSIIRDNICIRCDGPIEDVACDPLRLYCDDCFIDFFLTINRLETEEDSLA